MLKDRKKEFLCLVHDIRDQVSKLDRLLAYFLKHDKDNLRYAKTFFMVNKSLFPVFSHSFYTHFSSSVGGFGAQRLATKRYFTQLDYYSELDSKSGGKALAKRIGLDVVETVMDKCSWDDLHFPRLRESIIIKPNDGVGAMDVHALKNNDGRMVDCLRGTIYESFDEFKRVNSPCRSTSWTIEEFVCFRSGNPGVDVKFYAFYGHVCLILQIDRWREGGRQDYWFDTEGNFVTPRDNLFGKYKNYVESPASRPLFDKNDIRLSEMASKCIPTPFCRVDYLFSDVSGLKFCEFTINAGGPGSFNSFWDLKLGKEFQSAAARLMSDLCSGKKFDIINR